MSESDLTDSQRRDLEEMRDVLRQTTEIEEPGRYCYKYLHLWRDYPDGTVVEGRLIRGVIEADYDFWFQVYDDPEAMLAREGVYNNEACPSCTSRRGNEEVLFSLLDEGWYVDAERAARTEEEIEKKIR